MDRHIDEDLKQLHKDILRMGVFAQEAIHKSIEALKARDEKLAQEVIDSDIVVYKISGSLTYVNMPAHLEAVQKIQNNNNYGLRFT